MEETICSCICYCVSFVSVCITLICTVVPIVKLIIERRKREEHQQLDEMQKNINENSLKLTELKSLIISKKNNKGV